MSKEEMPGKMGKVTLHEFAGDHHEMGLQQGRKFKQHIARVISTEFLMGLEAFRLMKPKLIPAWLALRFGKRRATRLLKDDLFKHYLRQARRLEGMAEGSEQDLGTSSFCYMQSFF